MAALPLGTFFCLLWQTLPAGTYESTKFYYYLAMYCGLSLATTMTEVQVGCASVEVTQDYDERTTVTSYRCELLNDGPACRRRHTCSDGRSGCRMHRDKPFRWVGGDCGGC